MSWIQIPEIKYNKSQTGYLILGDFAGHLGNMVIFLDHLDRLGRGVLHTGEVLRLELPLHLFLHCNFLISLDFFV